MKNYFTPEINQKILTAAAIFHLLGGLIIGIFPAAVLNFFGVTLGTGIEFWQLLGISTAVWGIGQYIASFDSGRYWPIVLVGFLSSLFSAMLMAKSLATGSLPQDLALLLLVSALIWLLPFYYILLAAYDEHIVEASAPKKFHDLIRLVRTSQYKSLFELSENKKVLLVFVRHFGCTFCRETVAEVAKLEETINKKNMTLVFVHMSDPSFGDQFFSKYFDHPVHHISDPGRLLYQSLNMGRGTLHQLFGPIVWLRGFYAGIFKGHGIGAFEGDVLQLGGVFILDHGQIIFEQRALSASQQFQLGTLPDL